MNQSQEMQLSLEQKMSHSLSMKVMAIGQIIFELEEDYKNSLSRQAFAKLQQAKEILQEVAAEFMTPITVERMNNWKKEKEARTPKFVRVKEPWENWTEEQSKAFRAHVTTMMRKGFGGTK